MLNDVGYKKIKRRIENIIGTDNLTKNIALITGGTAMGQVANMLFTPLVTRIYTPEEYGLLSVFSSILLIFSFSSLKYEIAIPIASDDEEATEIFAISTIILTIVSFLILILLYVDSTLFLNLINAESLDTLKYFIPLGIFIQGFYTILRQWMFREKNYHVVSKTTVSQNLFGNLIKVILGLFNFGGAGLIIGRIVAVGSGSTNFIKKMKKNSFNISNINSKKIFFTAKKYIKFPLFQASSTAVVHFRNQFPVLFLTPLYGPYIVGLYGLANSIVKIPMNLIGQSVMDVFFAEIASIGKENPKRIKKLTLDLLKKLLLIGSIPVIIIFTFGPYLFEFIFGHGWFEAGVYARILSIYIFFNLVFSPISKIFEVFDKQGIKFGIDLSSLGAIFLVFYFARYFTLEPKQTIFLYSLVMSLVYLITFLISQVVLNIESNRIEGVNDESKI